MPNLTRLTHSQHILRCICSQGSCQSSLILATLGQIHLIFFSPQSDRQTRFNVRGLTESLWKLLFLHVLLFLLLCPQSLSLSLLLLVCLVDSDSHLFEYLLDLICLCPPTLFLPFSSLPSSVNITFICCPSSSLRSSLFIYSWVSLSSSVPLYTPLYLFLPLPFPSPPPSLPSFSLHPLSLCPFFILHPRHVFPFSCPDSLYGCGTVIIAALVIGGAGCGGLSGVGGGVVRET